MKHPRKRFAAALCLLAAAALLTCEKVPDYCGKGEWFDPSCQFCFAGKAYNQCGGNNYNPLTQGCIQGAEVGARCADGTAVPLGTPCGGYTLSAAAIPDNGGEISRTPNKQRYAAGEQLAASAAPAQNFAFVGWTGATNSAAPAVTILMNANKPLVAMFRPLNAPGTLIATAYPPNSGAIERRPDKTAYDPGETVTVTATAAPGYSFAGWAGATDSKNAAVTLTMTTDSKTLVAMFTPVARTLTINVNPADAGAVFVNGTALSGSVSQDSGAQIAVRAIAEKGYAFKEWTGTAEFADRRSANTYITPGTNATVTANFQPGDGDAETPDDSAKTPLYPVTVLIGGTTGAAVVGGSYAEGATVTITAGAAAEGRAFKGWTTTSGVTFADAGSATTTFIMPGRAVTVTAGFEGTEVVTPPDVVTPPGDGGGAFKTVVIGGQTWMAENLNVVTGNSWCYEDDEANCNVYGRLYTWDAAMTACPTGYHLPSREEWQTLVNYAGGDSVAGSKLKSTGGWYNNGNATDDYGFSALPGGFRSSDGSFNVAGNYGYWWTATEYSGESAYNRSMDYNSDFVNEFYGYKSEGFAVRCVLGEGTTTPPDTIVTPGDGVSQTVNGYAFEMVPVGGGTFMMGCTSEQGSDCFGDENPPHSVTVDGFYIGKYEVTQGLWKAVMGNLPSNLPPSSSWGYGDNYPVYDVSWDDIVTEFIPALNRLTGKTYRLPTEAEWEYAARGGASSRGYKYSGSNDIDDVAWYWENSGETTHPVGTKSPNELGIYDMSGNVFEWVSDWYGDYPSSAQTNPNGPESGSNRVARGGSWSSDARICRVSNRDYDYPGNGLGLRLVLLSP